MAIRHFTGPSSPLSTPEQIIAGDGTLSGSASTIPVPPGVPYVRMGVTLDGVAFRIELRWNARAVAWFLALSDPDGTPILDGRRVVVGFPLLTRFRGFALPAGDLVAIDTAGKDQEAGPNDLGARVQLVYLEAAALPVRALA